MKKFYFALCMTLLCGVISTNAQGPFRSAITPEINYPAVSNIAFRSDNTSAYSYGNLKLLLDQPSGLLCESVPLLRQWCPAAGEWLSPKYYGFRIFR